MAEDSRWSRRTVIASIRSCATPYFRLRIDDISVSAAAAFLATRRERLYCAVASPYAP